MREALLWLVGGSILYIALVIVLMWIGNAA